MDVKAFAVVTLKVASATQKAAIVVSLFLFISLAMLLSPNSRSLFRAPFLSNSLRYVNSLEWLREFEFTSAPLLTSIKVKTAPTVNNISQYFFAHEGLCNFSLSLYIGHERTKV